MSYIIIIIQQLTDFAAPNNVQSFIMRVAMKTFKRQEIERASWMRYLMMTQFLCKT
jgi:hypothetical protein